MKTRNVRAWRWIRLVSSAALVVTCTDSSRTALAQAPVITEAPAVRATAVTPKPETAATPGTNAPAKTAPGTGALLPADLSPALAEIVRLAETGVGDEVLLAFIKKSPSKFDLSADEVVYLNDLGLSDGVIAALMEHPGMGTAAGTGPAVYTPGSISTTPAPTSAPPAAVANPVAVSPGRTVTRTTTTTTENYPDVQYATPEAEYQNTTGAVIEDAPVVTSAPAEQVTINYFYDTLSPYGSWVDVSGYGRCWRPTVSIVNRGWRPYADRGRWLYSDAGWYWHSDYSWGWAPFHYGRWHSHANYGWVWVPGDVWAPAWVSWRRSSYYCGWAPLPPAACYDNRFGFHYFGSRVGFGFEFGLRDRDYCFVPTSRFTDRSPWRHRLNHDRARSIYNNTTVVNNYIVGNNNTVINEGIGRDHVASVTRSEVRRVSLQEISSQDRASVKPDRFVGNGNALAVFRPKFAPASRESAAAPVSTASTKTGSTTATPKPGMADRGNPAPVLKSDVLINRPEMATPNSVSAASPNSRPTLAQVQAVTPAAKVEAASRPSLGSRPGFASSRPGIVNGAKTVTPSANGSKVASLGRPGTVESTRSTLEVPSSRATTEGRIESSRPSARINSPLNSASRTTPGPQVTPIYKAPQPVISPDTTPSTSVTPSERPRFNSPNRGQSAGRFENSTGSNLPENRNSVSRNPNPSGSRGVESGPGNSGVEATPSSRGSENSSRPRFDNVARPQPRSESPRSVTLPTPSQNPAPQYQAPQQNSRPQFNPAPTERRAVEQSAPRSYQAPTVRPESRPQFQAPPQSSRPQVNSAPPPQRSVSPSPAPSVSRPSSPPPSAPSRSEGSSGRPGFRRDN